MSTLEEDARPPTTDDTPDPIAALRREIEHLRRELHELRGGRRATMREDVRCPGCGFEGILHVTEILDADGSGRNKLAIAQPSVWTSRRVGVFEAYVCKGCRLVEWYVQSLDDLTVDGQTIRLLEPRARGERQGPYR